MEQLPLAVAAVVGVPAATAGYVILAERLLELMPDRRRRAVRPWVWLAPALLLLTVFLVYPALQTLLVSLRDADSVNFVGLENYLYVFGDPVMLIALRNNVLWLVFFTGLTVGLGLLIAVLADRVPYEGVAKAVVFLPMAISFVAAG